jgi:hypothetical protein
VYLTPPRHPKPPAFATAATISAPATVSMPASITGCVIPRARVKGVTRDILGDFQDQNAVLGNDEYVREVLVITRSAYMKAVAVKAAINNETR